MKKMLTLVIVAACCLGAFPSEKTLAATPPEKTNNLSKMRCSEFQFTATAPFTDSKGKPQTTTAYLWIPEKCRLSQNR